VQIEGDPPMTDVEILGDIDTVPVVCPRRVVDTAAVAMIPSIVDHELAGVRARFAARLEAERRRVKDQIDRQAARAWWCAFEQRRSGKITSIKRFA
jgi:hypothetical protein